MPLVARNRKCDVRRLSSHMQHADPHGPRRQLEAEQLLGGQAEHQLVEDRRGVVHAGDVGAALEVGERLARLLHAGVQVADDRLGAQHGLAVELEHEAQHAVGAGVLRPHVDDHGLVVVGADRRSAASASEMRSTEPTSRRTSVPPGDGARRHLLGALAVRSRPCGPASDGLRDVGVVLGIDRRCGAP